MQEEARKPDIATVDLDTLEHENPRSVGYSCLALAAEVARMDRHVTVGDAESTHAFSGIGA